MYLYYIREKGTNLIEGDKLAKKVSVFCNSCERFKIRNLRIRCLVCFDDQMEMIRSERRKTNNTEVNAGDK